MTTPYSTDMYPVQFDVEYPEGGVNRLTALVRILLAMPVLIVITLIGRNSFIFSQFDGSGGSAQLDLMLMPFGIFMSTALMILFRNKYPRWWFDWSLELARFQARVGAYLFLLRDEYPSTDDHQAVTLDIAYPDVESQLNRVLPLFKWLLAIPHYIALTFLGIGAVIVVVIAWIAILITGQHPLWSFRYLVGVSRWSYRVGAYAFLMTTDRYPPFRLAP